MFFLCHILSFSGSVVVFLQHVLRWRSSVPATTNEGTYLFHLSFLVSNQFLLPPMKQYTLVYFSSVLPHVPGQSVPGQITGFHFFLKFNQLPLVIPQGITVFSVTVFFRYLVDKLPRNTPSIPESLQTCSHTRNRI